MVWLGFNQAFVPYEREKRHAGTTQFPFFSRNPWKTFVLGVTSFSFMPIYLIVALAAAGLVASVLLLVAALTLMTLGSAGAGRTALIAMLAFGWSTIMGAIGAVGIYLIRIYKDVRGRPAYIVESTIGLSTTDRSGVDELERARP